MSQLKWIFHYPYASEGSHKSIHGNQTFFLRFFSSMIWSCIFLSIVLIFVSPAQCAFENPNAKPIESAAIVIPDEKNAQEIPVSSDSSAPLISYSPLLPPPQFTDSQSLLKNHRTIFASSASNIHQQENSNTDGLLTQTEKEISVSSFVGPRYIGDYELADIILVCSIDGSIHARDRQTGMEIWSIPGDRPLVQVSSPLDSMPEKNVEATEDSEDSNLIWIVEPLSDGILYYFTPATGLQQLPISIKQLVSQSPFALQGDDKIYTGSRQTTLFSIDSVTGKVLKVYGARKSDLGSAKCRVSQKSPFNKYMDQEKQVAKNNNPDCETEEDSNVEDEEDFFDYDYQHWINQQRGSFLIGRTGMLYSCIYFVVLRFINIYIKNNIFFLIFTIV